MSTNPASPIDREDLQASYDAAMNSLDGAFTTQEVVGFCTDAERAGIHAWMTGGMFDFLRETER